MPTVMPRFLRPRLLLLPLAVGTLLIPAFLTSSAMSEASLELHAGNDCKNAVVPVRKLDKIEPPRKAPTCVTCRAPLINAPLAQAGRIAPATGSVELPPTA
jgi:hypothetical protein